MTKEQKIEAIEKKLNKLSREKEKIDAYILKYMGKRLENAADRYHWSLLKDKLLEL